MAFSHVCGDPGSEQVACQDLLRSKLAINLPAF